MVVLLCFCTVYLIIWSIVCTMQCTYWFDQLTCAVVLDLVISWHIISWHVQKYKIICLISWNVQSTYLCWISWLADEYINYIHGEHFGDFFLLKYCIHKLITENLACTYILYNKQMKTNKLAGYIIWNLIS